MSRVEFSIGPININSSPTFPILVSGITTWYSWANQSSLVLLFPPLPVSQSSSSVITAATPTHHTKVTISTPFHHYPSLSCSLSLFPSFPSHLLSYELSHFTPSSPFSTQQPQWSMQKVNHIMSTFWKTSNVSCKIIQIPASGWYNPTRPDTL